MKKNRRLYKILGEVKKHINETEHLTDEELQAKTSEFRRRLEGGASLNSLLPEAYAVCWEADRRILGMAPFDVQILCAIALHYGYLTEMNTGEGKTLTATMPLYLNALTGKSCILVTANEYLATRDAEEMGPVYRFLGLTVMAGSADDEKDNRVPNAVKKKIYGADITYTTHAALGFDYLMNNLVKRAEDRFLRDFYFVVIDEADAVLLDAARMPLVISGAPRVQSNLYQMADFFVTTLIEDEDYEIEGEKAVWLTKKGVAYAEHFFGIDKYYSAENFEINRHVTLALRAHTLMERGKDYMVSDDDEVLLLDNSTGRALQGMKLRGGAHQAIEAKEKVKISPETRSMASVTYQNLFQMFPKFCGMSGTMADAKRELRRIYKKKVVVIPPNRPLMRRDLPDRFYKNSELQFNAAVEDIIQRHSTGQPVLVVANNIADTEQLSRMLVEQKIPHSLLNANNAYWEAEMIKEAGLRDAVTVSTGIAGRGTDIKLAPGVKELGGLAVIGVGRMGNVRQERQARGRSGRQGDPGESRFYVSLEDDVASSIGDKRLEKYVDKDRPISERRLKRLINGAQKTGEEGASSQRENAADYDKIMKKQRAIMYKTRNTLLDGGTLDSEHLNKAISDCIHSFLRRKNKITRNDISRFVLDNLSYRMDADEVKLISRSRRKRYKMLRAYAARLLEEKKQALGSQEKFDEFVRLATLHSIDSGWIEQVDYLQQLQGVVSGRSSAQRNPLFEYHREAYTSFNEMISSIMNDTVRSVYLGEPKYNKDGDMYILYP